MKAAEFKVVQDARRVVQGQFSHYYQVMSRASMVPGKPHTVAGADKKVATPPKTAQR